MPIKNAVGVGTEACVRPLLTLWVWPLPLLQSGPIPSPTSSLGLFAPSPAASSLGPFPCFGPSADPHTPVLWVHPACIHLPSLPAPLPPFKLFTGPSGSAGGGAPSLCPNLPLLLPSQMAFVRARQWQDNGGSKAVVACSPPSWRAGMESRVWRRPHFLSGQGRRRTGPGPSTPPLTPGCCWGAVAGCCHHAPPRQLLSGPGSSASPCPSLSLLIQSGEWGKEPALPSPPPAA